MFRTLLSAGLLGLVGLATAPLADAAHASSYRSGSDCTTVTVTERHYHGHVVHDTTTTSTVCTPHPVVVSPCETPRSYVHYRSHRPQVIVRHPGHHGHHGHGSHLRQTVRHHPSHGYHRVSHHGHHRGSGTVSLHWGH